ncbi:MAG: methyltransferase domain-containing protein [Opitutales bacterium]|nr:methyltransferase domain-containing protein [Opitutales bacterium]
MPSIENKLTYDLSHLEQSQQKWQKSNALQFVYGQFYKDIQKELSSEYVLELGSGIGNGKEFIPELITSDIIKTPFVDRAVDAYNIPEEHWSAIIALDVLHHLQQPFAFFESATRALKPSGRIVMIEPAATPFGRLFYGLFHEEPIIPEKLQAPYEFPADNEKGLFANMGMGVALFKRDKFQVEKQLNKMGLKLISLSWRDFLAYPLTGGYSGPTLAPGCLIRGMMNIESWLPQCMLKMLALRMVIVLEKQN